MARAQQKTSSTEREALGINTQHSTGHIDYRGMTSREIKSAWMNKFKSSSDRALSLDNLERIDRHWRKIANAARKPGGKY